MDVAFVALVAAQAEPSCGVNCYCSPEARRRAGRAPPDVIIHVHDTLALFLAAQAEQARWCARRHAGRVSLSNHLRARRRAGRASPM